MESAPYGYAGKFLRVDLSRQQLTEEVFDRETLRLYLGGTALGAKILYEEVPPGTDCFDPENRVIIASGPLGGSRLGGSGTYSVATKGALTGGATSTQANGLFGAYLRFSGFDGIIVQGAASDWQYLYIHEGQAELRDARQLVGQDTWQMEDSIRRELGCTERELSVIGIGPAGENRVRFAAVCGDKGHIAGHNGPGAALGAKKLKAIAAARKGSLAFKDRPALAEAAALFLEGFKGRGTGALNVFQWGTLQGVTSAVRSGSGWLPVKNYQTNVWRIEEEKLSRFGAEDIRSRFPARRKPCWACQAHHCHTMRITDGPYAGMQLEEPEYEGFAACGPVIGNTDALGAIVLANDVDRLGMEVNEAGWVLSFIMECYEKGILTREDTDGLDMTWGNVEAARAMLRRIASRQGFGDLMAEGVRRAAQRLGPEAAELGIYTQKGNSPRGHDHRVVWFELFDTSVSNTGTIESTQIMPLRAVGLSRLSDPFSPEEIAELVARTKGFLQFEDSLGVCRFNTRTDVPLLCRALNAATGWELTVAEAREVGLRAVNLMRLFNIRHGISPELDGPSPRYGSTPPDGPAQGIAILPAWPQMLQRYYDLMGWDSTGIPKGETLRQLGLEWVLPDLP